MIVFTFIMQSEAARACFKRGPWPVNFGLGPVKMWCSWSFGPAEFFKKKVFVRNGAAYSQSEIANY